MFRPTVNLLQGASAIGAGKGQQWGGGDALVTFHADAGSAIVKLEVSFNGTAWFPHEIVGASVSFGGATTIQIVRAKLPPLLVRANITGGNGFSAVDVSLIPCDDVDSIPDYGVL